MREKAGGQDNTSTREMNEDDAELANELPVQCNNKQKKEQ